MVSKQILYFLAQLDIKEIHGYNPDLGLSVFTEDALKRINTARYSDTVTG
jgi:arginine decarboxylase